MKTKYGRYINSFRNRKILVIGDLMLDKYVYGTVARISPEAPVPVLDVSKETYLPGGAGNVVNNLSELGAEVYLAAVIGRDQAAEQLLGIFRGKKGHAGRIRTEGLLSVTGRPTTIKTRIIAQQQQVVRVDREQRRKIPAKLVAGILKHIRNTVSRVDGVLISDYGKGVILPEVLTEAISLSNKRGIPVTVDPKIENFMLYRDITCMTPNLNEAVTGMRADPVKTDKDTEKLGKSIVNQLNCRSLIITRGSSGMSVFEKNKKPLNIPTMAKEVFDVSGAGDTVISTLTLCLASGAPLKTSAEIANYAAGIVVGKFGTATVTAGELLGNIE